MELSFTKVDSQQYFLTQKHAGFVWGMVESNPKHKTFFYSSYKEEEKNFGYLKQ
jgi:hypothetical protein